MSNESIDAIAQEQAKTWQAAADRADIRGESALAICFRNVAYQLKHGKLSLTADTETIEQHEVTNV